MNSMTEVTITQITPRIANGEVESIKLHFTYTIKIGNDSASGAGSINIDNFNDLVNFEGLSNKIRHKLSENI